MVLEFKIERGVGIEGVEVSTWTTSGHGRFGMSRQTAPGKAVNKLNMYPSGKGPKRVKKK